MIDNNDKVYSLLAPLESRCAVIFGYPEEITSFPCVTFIDTNHSNDNYADGIARADIVTVTIDIWEKPDPVTGVTDSIHLDVAQIMTGSGDWFDAGGFSHIYEADTGVHHYVQRYSKVEAQS